MATDTQEPDRRDELKELVQELTQKGHRPSVRQVKAFGAMLGEIYERPWWYWEDYFRAIKN